MSREARARTEKNQEQGKERALATYRLEFGASTRQFVFCAFAFLRQRGIATPQDVEEVLLQRVATTPGGERRLPVRRVAVVFRVVSHANADVQSKAERQCK